MKKIAFVLAALWVSLPSFSYDGWSGQHAINSVRVYSADQVYITMTDDDNPGECENTTYLALKNVDTAHGQRLYSSILTAYASGKEVQLALTGCTGGDNSGYPIIEQVWLK